MSVFCEKSAQVLFGFNRPMPLNLKNHSKNYDDWRELECFIAKGVLAKRAKQTIKILLHHV